MTKQGEQQTIDRSWESSKREEKTRSGADEESKEAAKD